MLSPLNQVTFKPGSPLVASGSPAPEAAATPADRCLPGRSEESHSYKLVPGLTHMAATQASPSTGRAALIAELSSHMRAYPSLRAVIAVVPQADHQTTSLFVVGRPDAVKQSRLDGPFEVTARLSEVV